MALSTHTFACAVARMASKLLRLTTSISMGTSPRLAFPFLGAVTQTSRQAVSYTHLTLPTILRV